MPEGNNQAIGLLHTIDQLVGAGYCVGCGLCVAVCPDPQARMVWNELGAYEPRFGGADCSECRRCAQVCPFSDGVIAGVSNPTEDELGERLFKADGAIYDSHIGYHQGCYAGYAPEFRSDSTSGGLTTWVLTHLMETGQIDRVICVGAGDDSSARYAYQIFSTPAEVRAGAKSRYYPVHLADALKVVQAEEARYAIVAIPCLLKGIRYAQAQDPVLQERIKFCVSIFCGGLKTAYFTEYLAAQIGIGKDEIRNPEYRIKHAGEGSEGYYFGCADPHDPTQMREFRVKKLKDLWGPGYFKPNVCDYCDDVVGETADLSAGDAWFKPYSADWRGNNIVITRSPLAEQVIQAGLESEQITLDPIPASAVVRSQRGNFDHRRKGLAYRLHWAGNGPVPRKRVRPQAPPSFIVGKIYRLRMRVREKSHAAWLKQRSQPGTQIFDRIMNPDLNRLRRWQKIDQMIRKITKR